jgi:hypothetical protein
MSKQVLAQILLAAKSENVLPARAIAPAQDERPWPVLILTAVGAWLAAIPLMLAAWSLMESTGVYFIGAVLIGIAVVSLRSQMLTLFLE